MNYLQDSSFTSLPNKTVPYFGYGQGIGSSWHIKHAGAMINANFTKVSDGLRVDALFTGFGYLYFRQWVQGLKQFSGKKVKLIIDISRNSWQEIEWDVYVNAKVDTTNINRVNIIDTDNTPLAQGRQLLEVELEIPDVLSNPNYVDGIANLEVTFRLIGDTENTSCTIHSIKLEDSRVPTNEEEGIDKQAIQYTITKLQELLDV